MTAFITASSLRKAFTTWWGLRQMPLGLIAHLTPETAHKPLMYRSMITFERLHDMAWDQLTDHRRQVGIVPPDIPQTIDAMAVNVRRDFSPEYLSGMNDLMLWSAVYHYYMAPLHIQQPILAQWAGMSERHLRRYLCVGLEMMVYCLSV